MGISIRTDIMSNLKHGNRHAKFSGSSGAFNAHNTSMIARSRGRQGSPRGTIWEPSTFAFYSSEECN